jgi:hypothetical protein
VDAPVGELYTMVMALASNAVMLRSAWSVRIGLIALALLLPAEVSLGVTASDQDVVANVVVQTDAGQFAAASAQIDQALAQLAVDARLHEVLGFQRDDADFSSNFKDLAFTQERDSG